MRPTGGHFTDQRHVPAFFQRPFHLFYFRDILKYEYITDLFVRFSFQRGHGKSQINFPFVIILDGDFYTGGYLFVIQLLIEKWQKFRKHIINFTSLNTFTFEVYNLLRGIVKRFNNVIKINRYDAGIHRLNDAPEKAV